MQYKQIWLRLSTSLSYQYLDLSYGIRLGSWANMQHMYEHVYVLCTQVQMLPHANTPQVYEVKSWRPWMEESLSLCIWDARFTTNVLHSFQPQHLYVCIRIYMYSMIQCTTANSDLLYIGSAHINYTCMTVFIHIHRLMNWVYIVILHNIIH